MSRELNDLGDIIVNDKLTIKELYEFAKENGFEDSTLYFIGRKKDDKFSDIYSDTVTTFGKGWSKGTAILKFDYEKEEKMGGCIG
jgi:hypothetical protein